MSVTIERQRAQNKVKLCYRCNGFNHSSLDCRLTPKCMVCSGPHLRPDCPFKGQKITPTCPNCSGPHVSTFSGCPRHPQNLKKLKTDNNGIAPPPPPPTLPLSKSFAEALRSLPANTKAPAPQHPQNSTNNSASTPPGALQAPAPSTSKNPTNSESLAAPQCSSNTEPPPPPLLNCLPGLDEISATLQDFSQIITLTKLINCIKTMCAKFKDFPNPLDRALIMLAEFEAFSQELSCMHNS